MATKKAASKRGKASAKKSIKLTAERQLYIILVLLLLLFVLFLYTQCIVPKQLTRSDVSPLALEMPKTESNEFILPNTEGRYTVMYDTSFRQPAWVAYVLTRDEVNTKGSSRSNNFTTDKRVKDNGWEYSTSDDYLKSGYDRGHMLPSADRDDSQSENNATFLMSNISPQRPNLNRKLWNSLESEVRDIARSLDSVFIVTGIIKGEKTEYIGKNKVGVPDCFFKTILAKRDGEYISIAFILPNSNTLNSSFWSYAVSVDSLEKLVGCDFFYNLPDDLENITEKQCDKNAWQ